MKCTFPLTAYWTGKYTNLGKKLIEFKPPKSERLVKEVLTLPCGKCISCRLKKSKETAIRAVHESRSYEKNCFITLTVAEEYINEIFPNGSLDHRPFQLFAKRLRKRFKGDIEIQHPITGEIQRPIRFLMCGEYGEDFSRPHYHACVFNFDFEDKYLYRTNYGVKLYRSHTLEKLWKYGFATIGEVNFESAAYLARYITKKIGGKMAEDHYQGKKPEYIVFPSGYGLGRIYYEKYKDQWYDQDLVRMGKHIMKPSKYYDKIFDVDNPKKMQYIKECRIKQGEKTPDLRPERRKTIDKVIKNKIKFKTGRSLENGQEL